MMRFPNISKSDDELERAKKALEYDVDGKHGCDRGRIVSDLRYCGDSVDLRLDVVRRESAGTVGAG